MKKTFVLKKVIRDKLYETFVAEGVEVISQSLTKAEALVKMKGKLLEEAQEVVEANNRGAIREELADVLEVIECIATMYAIPYEEIQQEQRAKRQQKGGFGQCIYVDHIVLDDRHPIASYFDENPKYDLRDSHATNNAETIYGAEHSL